METWMKNMTNYEYYLARRNAGYAGWNRKKHFCYRQGMQVSKFKLKLLIRSSTKVLFCFLAVIMTFFCLSSCSSIEISTSRTSIRLLFNSDEVIVDLYDNAAAKDFISLLPLTLVFDDYNSSEKTSNLPNDRLLDTSGAPKGYDPRKGELGYYAPWGNMVIYHRDFPYASGIVPLGKFRSGEEKFTAIHGEVTILFELYDSKAEEELPNPDTSKPDNPSVPEKPADSEKPLENGKMNIHINSVTFQAEFSDNATAKAFAKMLPLTIQMSDLNSNEKYYYLHSNLPTNSYRPQIIQKGDLMLYGSNCLVLFYDTFSSPYSYTRIGKILDTAGLLEVVGSGSITISFSL